MCIGLPVSGDLLCMCATLYEEHVKLMSKIVVAIFSTLHGWCENASSRYRNGSLIQLITKNGNTDLIPVEN